MRLLFKMFGGLAMAVCAAPALERELVDRIVESARSIERDASAVGQALKPRRPDSGEVVRKIDAMSADVAKLQEVVAQLESSDPVLSDRDRADWQLVKDKVQLLSIFHERKKTLAAEDIGKHRSLIRAHANGLALRAQKLQQTASRLLRQPSSRVS